MNTVASPLFQQAADMFEELRAAVPNNPRISDDEEGVMLAYAASIRADCSRRRVGAIIVDKTGRVVSTGRNGAPAGRPGCLTEGACPRGRMSTKEIAPGSGYTKEHGNGLCHALHAEVNSCLYASRDKTEGGTVYVTDAPCDECSKIIVGAGLARAVWPELNDDGNWTIRSYDLSGAIGGHYSSES